MRMAEIFKVSYYAEKCQSKEEVGGKSSKHLQAKASWKEKGVPKFTTKGKKEVKKLTRKEVKKRVKKGLCIKLKELA